MPPYSPPHSDSSSSCDVVDAETSVPSRGPLHRGGKSAAEMTTERGKGGGRRRDDELLRLAASELEAMRSPEPPDDNSQRSGKTCARRGSDGSTGSGGGRSSRSPSPLSSSARSSGGGEVERPFPPACLALLRSTIPSSSRCHDCSSPSDGASWASVSFGITLCLRCSGKHRGLGVDTSFVKSLTLDSWKRREILAMLEGGNEQLGGFFGRHGMGGGDAGGVGGTGNDGNLDGSNRSSSNGSNDDNNDNGNSGNVGGMDRYRTKAASFYRQHLLSHTRRVAQGGPYAGREASRSNNDANNNNDGGGNRNSGGRDKKTHESGGGGAAGPASPDGKSRRKKPREGSAEKIGRRLSPVTEKDGEADSAPASPSR